MICGNALCSTLYREAAGKTAYSAGKKDSKAYAAELFHTEEEENGKKRGKQSVIDDAKAAGKHPSAPQPKTETESRIVVKPDGTRVLIITVRCGQSVRMKSLKLSDKADMENEGKQEGVSGQEEGPSVKEGQGKGQEASSAQGTSVGNTADAIVGEAFVLAGEAV